MFTCVAALLESLLLQVACSYSCLRFLHSCLKTPLELLSGQVYPWTSSMLSGSVFCSPSLWGIILQDVESLVDGRFSSQCFELVVLLPSGRGWAACFWLRVPHKFAVSSLARAAVCPGGGWIIIAKPSHVGRPGFSGCWQEVPFLTTWASWWCCSQPGSWLHPEQEIWERKTPSLMFWFFFYTSWYSLSSSCMTVLLCEREIWT